MGYTHYWYRQQTIPQAKYAAIVADMERALELVNRARVPAGMSYEGSPVHLCDGMGKTGSRPRLDQDEISFNGDEAGGHDHETFYFPRDLGPKESWESGDRNKRFGFTKTARKPYDLAVCLALYVLKHHLGDKIHVSSDGDRQEEGWPHARKLALEMFGPDVPELPDEG